MARWKERMPGSVFADKRTGLFTIKMPYPDRFDSKGHRLNYRENTGIADTPAGKVLVRERQKQVYQMLYVDGYAAPDKKKQTVLLLSEAWSSFMAQKKRDKLYQPGTTRNLEHSKRVIFGSNNPYMTEQSITQYLQHYVDVEAVERRHSEVTVKMILRHIYLFVNFCIKEKLLPQTDYKPRMRRAAKTKEEMARGVQRSDDKIKVFKASEIPKMLEAFYAFDEEFGILNEFMLETGARPVDALTLHFNQFDSPAIIFLNKITGREERSVVSKRTHELMERMKELAAGREKVFRWKHSTLPKLSQWFRTLMEQAGVERRGRSFKHYRTTFKRSISSIGSFELQMKLMRHSTADVTLGNYSSLGDEFLERALALKTLPE